MRLVEVGVELRLGLPLRLRDAAGRTWHPSLSDQEADLVEEVEVRVPPERDAVELDDLVPERVRLAS